MVDTKILQVKQDVTSYAFEIGEDEVAVINFIVRETAGAASLYGSNDTVTTNINFGTGPNVEIITIGNGDSLLNFGADLEINGDFSIGGNIVLINQSAGVGTDAAFAIERGLDGQDSLIYWDETNDQFEIGFGQTSGGVSIPSSPLGTYSDLKVNNLLLDGSTVTGAGALSFISAGTETNLILGARSVSINFNDANNTTLDELYSATSIVGALNEAKTGNVEIKGLGNTYINGEAIAISRGQLVYISDTDEVSLAIAASNNNLANPIGVVKDATIDSGLTGIIGSNGVFQVRFESGLSLVAGQEVYLSSTTSGAATNIRPATAGNIIQPIGILKDILSYNGTSNFIAEVNLAFGQKAQIN